MNITKVANIMWKETDQLVVEVENRESSQEARQMSVVVAFDMEAAAQCAAKMVQHKTKGWGDEPRALDAVGRECGLSPRSLKRLIRGETKDIGSKVCQRIHGAYLTFCRRLINQLQHDIAIHSERYGDAPFEDIVSKVEVLAEEVRLGIERTRK